MGTYNSNPCLEEVRASLMMIGLTSSQANQRVRSWAHTSSELGFVLFIPSCFPLPCPLSASEKRLNEASQRPTYENFRL